MKMPEIIYKKKKYSITGFLPGILFMLCFIPWNVTAQTSKSDSLKQLVAVAQPDTNLVNLYIELGLLYEDLSSDTAIQYYLKAEKLSKKLDYPAGYCRYAVNHVFVLNRSGEYDSSLAILQEALQFVNDHHYGNTADLLLTYGNTNMNAGNYERALDYFLQALRMFEQQNNLAKSARVLSNLGALYIYLEDYQKSFEYCAEALEISRKIDDKLSIATNLTNMSDYYFDNNDTAQTLIALTEARDLFHELGNTRNESNALSEIGDYYSYYFDDFDKAIEIYWQSMDLLVPGENSDLWMDAYRKISLAYYQKGEFELAVDYLQKGIAFTDTTNLNLVRMNYYLQTEYYIGLKDVEKATSSFESYIELTRKVFSDSQTRKIAELEIKYETEKKEMQIMSMQKERKLILCLSISIGAALLLLLAVLLFRQRLMNQKKKLAEQQVKQLEQEQQLIATKAVLDGETTERSRLARDLHDGLGGMLSAVKFNLHDMKQGRTLESDDVARFDKAMDMLDASINELRRVAHNMMPESLSRYGLKTALTDFCASMSNIHFHYFGSEARLDRSLEIMLYRTVIELVNNAVKHAAAENIHVQIVQETDRLALNVQDDGKGFDSEVTGNGTGLKNIRNRVESFNGTFDIFSKVGEGTEISAEFKLQNTGDKHD